MKYPEINQLQALQKQYGLKVSVRNAAFDRRIFADFFINNKSWALYLDDEYNDFKEEKQLLAIFLVLRALEDYKEAADFTDWCQQNGLDASSSDWLTYYKQLAQSYAEIEDTIGTIDSFINSLDYQLRSGAFSELVSL
ncbi:MAG: hypothetical protein K8H85_02880 [Cyclobacteriaceae bacterium]|nr:hypothetical protein [Cyclobacteriaceae bacterium]